MSAPNLEEIQKSAINGATDTCWQQWTDLGAPTAMRRHSAAAIVDPEALILLTLPLCDRDRRLLDILDWWARTGSAYTSLQRLTTLAESFPDDVRERLPLFAQLAERTGDRRFARLARSATSPCPPTREKGGKPPRLDHPPALMVRLRAAFGLTIKPDLLTVLLGSHGRARPIRDLLAATAYSEPPLRQSAQDLANAGLVRASSERPVRFSADVEAWGSLLGSGTGAAKARRQPSGSVFAPWCFWGPIFAFLLATASKCDTLTSRMSAPYPTASALRDVFEEHRAAFELNEIRAEGPDRYEGTDFIDAFEETVFRVVTWLREGS